MLTTLVFEITPRCLSEYTVGFSPKRQFFFFQDRFETWDAAVGGGGVCVWPMMIFFFFLCPIREFFLFDHLTGPLRASLSHF